MVALVGYGQGWGNRYFSSGVERKVWGRNKTESFKRRGRPKGEELILLPDYSNSFYI